MISVGIDIAKRKSTVCALKDGKKILWKPFNIYHQRSDVESLIAKIKALDEEVKIIMEATGIYHKPLLISLKDAGLFVSVVNPLKMKRFCQALSFRNVKTDNSDSLSIAEYGLINWFELKEAFEDNDKFKELKELNRAYQHYQEIRIKEINYLGKEIEKRHPGLKKLIAHSNNDYKKDKLLDFVERWPNSQKIRKRSEIQFIKEYENWARKKGYHPDSSKARLIYENTQKSIPTISSSNSILDANVLESIKIMRTINKALNNILSQMQKIATGLEEYEVLKDFTGIGDKLALQIASEFGDLSKFKNKKSLISYVGIDSPAYQSGEFKGTRRKISKRGNAILRKVLFLAMMCMKRSKKINDPIYVYVLKKESEGKAKKVANIAGINKLLRIYYARVMEVKEYKKIS